MNRNVKNDIKKEEKQFDSYVKEFFKEQKRREKIERKYGKKDNIPGMGRHNTKRS